MRIGEAAALAHVRTSLIRFYEEKGVLPKPRRTSAGYRDYTADDVDLISFAKKAQTCGFSLEDVGEMVACQTLQRLPRSALRATITEKVAAIDSQIAELRELKVDLARLQALIKDS